MTLTSSACPEPFDCLAGAQDKLGPWPSRGTCNTRGCLDFAQHEQGWFDLKLLCANQAAEDDAIKLVP